MRKIEIAGLVAAVAATGLLLPAAPALAQAAQAPRPAHYSVETTLAGTLIDDAAAAAVLQKLIPTIWANEMFQSAGRELTLKAIQQFETILTDEKLAEVQAELDKLPAKR